jgi:protein-tyrosine phosphatase
MIDLHTHILPGVDDGVETVEEALEFARIARDDGTRLVVATPHCKEGTWENGRDEVLRRVRELRELLARESVELELAPGAEVHLCPDLVERVRDGRAPTLGDNGKTLLLELSLTQYPVELDKLIFELKLAGLEIVLAHPERIRYFQEDPSRYESLVRLGAYGQVTTGSLLGLFGSRAREYSLELVQRGQVHVLASDAHGTGSRSPRLTEALEAIVPLVGEERARSMVNAVPRALLDGRTPEIPPVEGGNARRGGFFSRLFRRDGSGPSGERRQR